MITTPEKNGTVEKVFQKAGSRWQWLLFLRLASGVVLGTALLISALGLAVWCGWISANWVAIALAVLIGLSFGLGMLVAIMVSIARQKSKPWLAEQVEERIPSLMDRLNTLAFLESKKEKTFLKEIRQQAAVELTKNSDALPISAKPTALVAAAAIAACMGTMLFYQKIQPLAALWKTDIVPGAKLENTVEMELAEDTSETSREPWGEVRITEPGGDLKLTKVDVLPLTIEAASSQPLQHASFSTAVNGAKPTDHPLDAPKEPNYAVYEPMIYLDELGLADWDILSYYATAATDEPRKYASEIYFVEVRPFREDVLKLEQNGGAGSRKGQCLNKLNQIIEKQQDILRQTHRQAQKPAANEQQQAEDQKKLSTAQSDLEQATGHLYAEVAALEHMPVATVLEQLALAQSSMTEAIDKLRQPDNPTAETHEQTALQQLVESRKDFVRQLANGGQGQSNQEDQIPIAEDQQEMLKNQLADIEDFRNDAKAAQAAVQAAREEQEKIANEAAGADEKRMPDLAERQTEATQSLQDFRAKVPGPFTGLDKQAQAAIDAMEKTRNALGDSGSDDNPATTAQAAADALKKLQQALAGKMALRSLEDVYRLKSTMDSQAAAAKNGDAKAAAQAKAAKDAMAGTLKNTAAGKAFGPALSNALNGEPGRNLDKAVAQMAEQPGAGAQAASAIEEISKAFDAAQPPMLRGINRVTGQQGSIPGDGVSEAMRQLNSLVQRMKDGRAIDSEDLRKQLQDAQLALLDEAKLPDKDSPALIAVAEDLKTLSKEVDLQINEAALRKLMDRLEDYRLEMAGHEELEKNNPELRHADPEKAPAEFRERVRRYFEKLSNG